MGIGILLRLSPMENPNSPYVVVLDNNRTTIGRHAQVRMDTSVGKEVSKHHSTIYRRVFNNNEVWIIEDMSSLNGTFVNGRKIKRVFINSGDEIVFGGGSAFTLGDVVVSTEKAECRYRFVIPPPVVHFCPKIDLNASLMASDLLETCSICYCPTIVAEKLPCGHSFCLSCIHQWANVCVQMMRPCLCPMCRAPFNQSDLTPEEAQISDGKINVWAVEPMLRSLGLKSCKTIKGANIFKKWTEKHQKWFWSMYHEVESNDIRRNIFLYLTKATVMHVFKANEKDLLNAIENLGGCQKEKKSEMIIEVLELIFSKLIPKRNPHVESYYLTRCMHLA